jgi:hypothetical protein
LSVTEYIAEWINSRDVKEVVSPTSGAVKELVRGCLKCFYKTIKNIIFYIVLR